MWADLAEGASQMDAGTRRTPQAGVALARARSARRSHRLGALAPASLHDPESTGIERCQQEGSRPDSR